MMAVSLWQRNGVPAKDSVGAVITLAALPPREAPQAIISVVALVFMSSRAENEVEVKPRPRDET